MFTSSSGLNFTNRHTTGKYTLHRKLMSRSITALKWDMVKHVGSMVVIVLFFGIAGGIVSALVTAYYRPIPWIGLICSVFLLLAFTLAVLYESYYRLDAVWEEYKRRH